MLSTASFRRPSAPTTPTYAADTTAISVSFVQMLLIARSRRMCCSRVWRVMQNARRPSTSRVSPITRPGIFRTSSSRHAKIPMRGPP